MKKNLLFRERKNVSSFRKSKREGEGVSDRKRRGFSHKNHALFWWMR
ncbi:MAG: hypothetical protein JRE24_00920 [Deltaproteobacteria bacterium]|nr:hypothetical protein [Deltaproteobacteria bacterium]